MNSIFSIKQHLLHKNVLIIKNIKFTETSRKMKFSALLQIVVHEQLKILYSLSHTHSVYLSLLPSLTLSLSFFFA